MKPEEKIAALFLKNYFEKEPVHEPAGTNIPPDFAIDWTAVR